MRGVGRLRRKRRRRRGSEDRRRPPFAAATAAAAATLTTATVASGGVMRIDRSQAASLMVRNRGYPVGPSSSFSLLSRTAGAPLRFAVGGGRDSTQGELIRRLPEDDGHFQFVQSLVAVFRDDQEGRLFERRLRSPPGVLCPRGQSDASGFHRRRADLPSGRMQRQGFRDPLDVVHPSSSLVSLRGEFPVHCFERPRDIGYNRIFSTGRRIRPTKAVGFIVEISQRQQSKVCDRNITAIHKLACRGGGAVGRRSRVSTIWEAYKR